MKKKSKYEQVAEILDTKGYINDSEKFKIWGSEKGLWQANEHIRKYKRLEADRKFFANKKIIEVFKSHRCHIAELDTNENYKIGKEFYNETLKALTSR